MSRLPVQARGRLTLGDALPRELARVACDIVPAVARLGSDGEPLLDTIRGSIRLAALALSRNDSRLMRRAHEELLQYHV